MGWFERRGEADLRQIAARTLYDFEVECREQGWGIPPLSTTRRRTSSDGQTEGLPSPASTPTGHSCGSEAASGDGDPPTLVAGPAPLLLILLRAGAVGHEGPPAFSRPFPGPLSIGEQHLSFREDTPFEVWSEVVSRLKSAEKSIQWWLGDALRFGERLVATLDWLAETMAEGRAWMDSKRAARFLDMREDEFKRIAPRLPRHPIPREDGTRTRRFRYYAPELTGYLLDQHE